MNGWVGDLEQFDAPAPSGSASMTLLAMTDDEKAAALEREPEKRIGFAPPEASE